MDALDATVKEQLTFAEHPSVGSKILPGSRTHVSFYKDFEWGVATGKLNLNNATRALRLIIRQVDYFRVMVNNSLGSLSRGQELTLSRQEVDLEALLEEVVDLFDYLAEQKGVDIKLKVVGHPVIFVDRSLTHRLLVNLVDNAIKYSYSSSETSDKRYILIECHRYSIQNDWMIMVKSYGVGIDPEEIKSGSIFQYGARGKFATDRGRDGTGIGLAEAKRIAEAHLAEIKLESQRIAGDTFLTSARVILPDLRGREKHG